MQGVPFQQSWSLLKPELNSATLRFLSVGLKFTIRQPIYVASRSRCLVGKNRFVSVTTERWSQ